MLVDGYWLEWEDAAIPAVEADQARGYRHDRMHPSRARLVVLRADAIRLQSGKYTRRERYTRSVVLPW